MWPVLWRLSRNKSQGCTHSLSVLCSRFQAAFPLQWPFPGWPNPSGICPLFVPHGPPAQPPAGVLEGEQAPVREEQSPRGFPPRHPLWLLPGEARRVQGSGFSWVIFGETGPPAVVWHLNLLVIEWHDPGSGMVLNVWVMLSVWVMLKVWLVLNVWVMLKVWVVFEWWLMFEWPSKSEWCSKSEWRSVSEWMFEWSSMSEWWLMSQWSLMSESWLIFEW